MKQHKADFGGVLMMLLGVLHTCTFDQNLS